MKNISAENLQEFNDLRELAQKLIDEKLGNNFTLEHIVPAFWRSRRWTIKPLSIAGEPYDGTRTFGFIKKLGFFVEYSSTRDEQLAIRNCIESLTNLVERLKNIDEKTAKDFDLKFRRATTSYKYLRNK